MAPQDGTTHLAVQRTIKPPLPRITDPKELGYTSGFIKYPSYRDNLKWNHLAGKALLDAVGNGFWRVHDKLYNLEKFASEHPGGAWWIWTTSGQDITELFESSHITDTPSRLLEKYYVGEAKTARNSPYTFREDGFYQTLKRKVVLKLKQNGVRPTMKTHMIMDGIVALYAALACVAAHTGSIYVAILAGIVNHMVPACAHNYLHQRDSWRMYYVSLAQAFTVEEYRTFHVLSHHPFPNTVYDAEVFGLEPTMRMLVEKSKSWRQRWLAPVALAAMALFYATPLMIQKTIGRALMGTLFVYPEHFATFMQWIVFYVISDYNIQTATITWIVICHASFACTLTLALASTHHHPEDFHDGDTPRQDTDWGLHQLDTTNDRREYIGSLLMTSLLFGDHTLHHLFPTVDISHLHQLYPLLFETCKQFNVPHRCYSQLEMLFQQASQASNTQKQILGPERHQFRDYDHSHCFKERLP